MSEKRFLRTQEAADYVGLSPRTLEAFRTRGGGPPYVRFGGKRSGLCLYAVTDLDAWLQAHRRLSTSDPGLL